MPYYVYEARGSDGKFVRNQTFAANKHDLIKLLQEARLTILSIKESAAIGKKYHVHLHKGIKTEDLILFSKQLAILLENGIPIVEAFDVMLKQIESHRLLTALTALKKDLEGGTSFKEAVSKYPHIFGDFWRDTIEAGELSGQLAYVMRQIAGFLEAKRELREKTVNAFIYPALLVLLAISALFVFVYRIVPVFESFFETFQSKLPALTLVIVKLSYGLRQYFFLALQILILFIFVMRIIWTTRGGRRFFENLTFGTPFFGNFLLVLSIQRFVSMLSVLLKSGIPIIQALEVAKKAPTSLLFDEMIEDAKAKVVNGLPLSEALQQTGIFPTLVVQLVFVGEKTGNFSAMLDEIANFYKVVIDNAVIRFTTLLGPIVLICVAVLISLLVAAMFLPIFELTSI